MQWKLITSKNGDQMHLIRNLLPLYYVKYDKMTWKDRVLHSLLDGIKRKFFKAYYMGINCHCHYFWYVLSIWCPRDLPVISSKFHSKKMVKYLKSHISCWYISCARFLLCGILEDLLLFTRKTYTYGNCRAYCEVLRITDIAQLPFTKIRTL